MKKFFSYATAIVLGITAIHESSFGAEQHPITQEQESGPIVVSTRFDIAKIQTLLNSLDEQSKNGEEISVLPEEIIGSGALDLFRLFGMCLQYSAAKIGLESESSRELLSNLAQNIASCWEAKNAIKTIGTILHKLVYRYSTPEESKEIDDFLRKNNLDFGSGVLCIFGQLCGDKKLSDLNADTQNAISRCIKIIKNSTEEGCHKKTKEKILMNSVFLDTLRTIENEGSLNKNCSDLNNIICDTDNDVVGFKESNLKISLKRLIDLIIQATNPINQSDLINIRNFSNKIVTHIDWAYDPQKCCTEHIWKYIQGISSEPLLIKGTGTLISFQGVPEILKGKLVLTCGHFYANTSDPIRYLATLQGYSFPEITAPNGSTVAFIDDRREIPADKKKCYWVQLWSK